MTDSTDHFSRRQLNYWLVLLGVCLWRGLAMLPLKFHWLMGSALGAILHSLLKSRRRIALTNLQLCFPEQNAAWRELIVRRHFRKTGRAIFGTALGAWGSDARVARSISVHGQERVQSLLDDGQAVILVAPHCVDVMFMAMAVSRTLPVMSMYKQPRNALFHAIYRRVCTGESTGDRLADWVSQNSRTKVLRVAEHRQNLSIVVRAMRRMTAFLYLPDQDLGRRQSVFAPFFGVEAISNFALSRFASLAKAVIVPVYARHRDRGGKYDLYFLEPLKGIPSGDDVTDATLTNQAIESIVTTMPEHYFWVHKRFKTRPEGEASLY